MVLLFHGGVSWMHGGYFGVSVFFTLSGFLITSLLVREFSAKQRIAPVAFYARRAKRLLPASTLCLAIVSIMASRDVWRGALHVRRDAFGALFQLANWVQLAGGGSYTDLQSKSAGLLSPLDHYWSLAIEEQFYWLWPLCFWGMAR
ncbi:MAG: putative acyltransferase, partial [Ilumatobacteraceae bacterium]|nr:putative acyltransferase [Ilumatobacteraceae bacterium]